LQDDNGWTPLHIICRHQGADATVEVTKMLLIASSEALTSQTDCGSTPLHLACQDASMEMIKVLVEDPAAPEAAHLQGDDRWTPLHFFAAIRELKQQLRL
jgi:ankyrin repeat protein